MTSIADTFPTTAASQSGGAWSVLDGDARAAVGSDGSARHTDVRFGFSAGKRSQFPALSMVRGIGSASAAVAAYDRDNIALVGRGAG